MSTEEEDSITKGASAETTGAGALAAIAGEDAPIKAKASEQKRTTKAATATIDLIIVFLASDLESKSPSPNVNR